MTKTGSTIQSLQTMPLQRVMCIFLARFCKDSVEVSCPILVACLLKINLSNLGIIITFIKGIFALESAKPRPSPCFAPSIFLKLQQRKKTAFRPRSHIAHSQLCDKTSCKNRATLSQRAPVPLAWSHISRTDKVAMCVIATVSTLLHKTCKGVTE